MRDVPVMAHEAADRHLNSQDTKEAAILLEDDFEGYGQLQERLQPTEAAIN